MLSCELLKCYKICRISGPLDTEDEQLNVAVLHAAVRVKFPLCEPLLPSIYKRVLVDRQTDAMTDRITHLSDY